MHTKYSSSNFILYQSFIPDFSHRLSDYQFGYRGQTFTINNLLIALNNYTLNNPLNDYCFKHHWQFISADCKPNDSIIIKPTNKI
jgi:hypothetical protein